MTETVHLRSPDGATREVEARPEILVPLMVSGWQQCEPREEVSPDVRDADAGTSNLLR